MIKTNATSLQPRDGQHKSIPAFGAAAGERLRNRGRRLLPAIAMSILAVILSPGSEMAVGRTAAPAWVDVREYFPAGWQDREIDLKEYIQQAFNDNFKIYFPGSDNHDEPLHYHTTTGLEVPAERRVHFGPNLRIVRIPSRGRLFTLGNKVRFSGAVIDGNKYEHWPEFEDIGKGGGTAVHISSHCVVEDVVVFNNPGHAFASWGNYNKIYRCRAENIGYIDVRFNESFYRGAHDAWSGDGFYLRGEGNLVKDSEAYDTFRWDFCASHSGARQNTFVDCRGGDVHFSSYGFIDIEGAEGNNRLVRCISPNSRIVVALSAQTEVIQCMASEITGYDRPENIDRAAPDAGMRNHGILMDGNITTRGGIVLGGYWSHRQQIIPGGASPIIVNNRMYKFNHQATRGRSDFSFSVAAADGHGVVANNILFEYDDGERRGPGMRLYGIRGFNNQVLYGTWELDLPRPQLIYGWVRNPENLQGRTAWRPWED